VKLENSEKAAANIASVDTQIKEKVIQEKTAVVAKITAEKALTTEETVIKESSENAIIDDQATDKVKNEAKVVGLFTAKKEIEYIINKLYIDDVITKFKAVLDKGLNLAKMLHLIIFSSMLFCLWMRKKVLDDNPYPVLPKPEINLKTKISEPINKPKSIRAEEAVQFIKVKNL